MNTEKCVSQGAESPRADENELPQGESFHFISLFAIFSEPGEAAKSAAERSEPQTPSWTLPASPNMAQTPLCGSAVPMRRFPPVSDLKDAISACIPPRQRKIFAVARLLEAAGVLEAISDAHGRRGAANDRQCGRLPYRRVLLRVGPACQPEPRASARLSRGNEQDAVRSQLQECP